MRLAVTRPATAEPCVPSTWNSTSSTAVDADGPGGVDLRDHVAFEFEIAYAESSAVAAYLRPCSSHRSGNVGDALRSLLPRAEQFSKT
jgi:hypothetical protein